MDTELDRLRARLDHASRVTVLTGAGVSAASGVPTFRGSEGLWRHYRSEELATPEAFARDPRLVWEWYAWRRERIAACRPNAAHDALAAWSRRFPTFTLITQNVDGLHERAGTSNVVRFHGSIWEMKCSSCTTAPWRDEQVPLPSLSPTCPACGALARPNVVWFGEPIDATVLAHCGRALACDVFLVVGTSSVVYPAAGLLYEAAEQGAFTVEVNPEATAASDAVDLSIHAAAEAVLPTLL